MELDLCNAVDLVRSLREYVSGLRDQFDSFETAARNMSLIVSHEYKADTQRKKKERDRLMNHLSLSASYQAANASVHLCISISLTV